MPVVRSRWLFCQFFIILPFEIHQFLRLFDQFFGGFGMRDGQYLYRRFMIHILLQRYRRPRESSTNGFWFSCVAPGCNVAGASDHCKRPLLLVQSIFRSYPCAMQWLYASISDGPLYICFLMASSVCCGLAPGHSCHVHVTVRDSLQCQVFLPTDLPPAANLAVAAVGVALDDCPPVLEYTSVSGPGY